MMQDERFGSEVEKEKVDSEKKGRKLHWEKNHGSSSSSEADAAAAAALGKQKYQGNGFMQITSVSD